MTAKRALVIPVAALVGIAVLSGDGAAIAGGLVMLLIATLVAFEREP